MKEVERYLGTKVLAIGEDSVTQQAGNTLLRAGAGAAAIYGAAALIPFVSFFPLLLMVLVLGGYLKLKK